MLMLVLKNEKKLHKVIVPAFDIVPVINTWGNIKNMLREINFIWIKSD
jgi:hypothetical protein